MFKLVFDRSICAILEETLDINIRLPSMGNKRIKTWGYAMSYLIV